MEDAPRCDDGSSDEEWDEGLVEELAEETVFPQQLVRKFRQLWGERAPPHFTCIDDAGRMPKDGFRGIVRDLGVSEDTVLNSVCRVLWGKRSELAALDFAAFVRAYSRLQAPTLRKALPFVFEVYDLDGDGRLAMDEFRRMLGCVMALGGSDATTISSMVEEQFTQHEKKSLSFDEFAYFVSLNTMSIYATCAFMPKVQSFSASTIDVERSVQATTGTSDACEELGKDIMFFSEDFVESLESLKSTALERAQRYKEKGNAAFAGGQERWSEAVDLYTKGLAERADAPDLSAVLHGNRAAAHFSLGNYRRAFDDCKAALQLQPDYPKVTLRAARCALHLALIDEAAGFCAEVDEGKLNTGDKQVLRKTREKVRAALEKQRALVADARAKAEAEAALAQAIARRGLRVTDFRDEAVRAQLTGENAGARIYWDAAADEIHWPVLFLYPQHQQTDFLQDVAETACIGDLVEHVLPTHGPSAPWDTAGEFRPHTVDVYLAAGTETGTPVLLHLSDSLASALKRDGAVIGGIPIMYVLLRGSAFEVVWRKEVDLDPS